MPRQILHCLLISLILLLFTLNAVRAEQRIVEEPEDTVARIGETVILKCRVQNQRGQVIWMKGDIGLGYKRDLPFWERMSMVGSLADGAYHLEIRNVTLADEDTYQCQLSSTDDEPVSKLSRKAQLTVIAEPQPPVFLGESIASLQSSQPIATTEGQAIRISCQSSGGKPPAKISWAIAEDREAQKLIARIGNGSDAEQQQRHFAIHPMRVREHSPIHPSRHAQNQHLSGNITESVEFNEDSQLYTTTSHLIFSPRREENGRWLVCLSNHQAYGIESRSASIEMDIYYAPKVRVEIDMAESKLYEGGYVQFRCLSDARPNEDLKYNWKWDSTDRRRLNVKNSEQARIDGLRFNDNGKRVSCTVENSIGTGNGVLELDVPYGPQFMSTNQTKTVERGSEATFQCEALGNPQPVVRWFHGRDWDTPVFEGKNFTIHNAQDWEEGEYRCTAEVNGFPPKTLYHMLYLKGPPKVRLSEYIVTDGGTTVMLVCEIQSRAMPLRVHWFHNGHRVDIDHASSASSSTERRRYNVQDEKVGRHELISRLTISGFGKEDFGKWNCSAKNDYGLVWDQREIEVLGFVEKFVRYAQGLPLKFQLCILASIVFILLMPLLICCLCRRCCRPNGHSKLSNHSSDQRGEFSGAEDGEPSLLSIIVKCEELDGLTNSSTPPYSQMHHFYTADAHHQSQQLQPPQCDGGDYLCGGPPQFNPDMDHQSAAMYGQSDAGGLVAAPGYGQTPLPHQFNEYFNNGGGAMPSPILGSQHLSNGHASGIMLNGVNLNGGIIGGPNSFGGANGNTSFNGSTHSFSNLPPPGPMNPYDSFGIARVQYQQQPSQQQYYAYTGPSPLEPVTEVCTPESQDGCGQLIQTDEPERPISRISTHV